MKRLFLLLVFLLLLGLGSPALADVSVSWAPESPRVGDYVDLTVSPGREGAESVTYVLYYGSEKVFEGKPVDHFTASFRPRQEGTCTLQVTVSFGKKDQETAEVKIPVSGTAPAQEGPEVVYSQKDGYWHDKIYSKANHRSVEKAGCALFTLSHALQRMGHTEESVTPDALAAAYSRFYIKERGTNNEGLITQAALDYDFVTQEEMITDPKEIVACLRRGDYFSFGIVLGHIALADGVSEDGKFVHVVDSAPSATYERKDRFKTKGHVYYQKEDGTFEEAVKAEDLPGIRWFFETQEYGGMAYWLNVEYCAVKEMRLIRPAWLRADLGEGLKNVNVDYAGALVSRVTRGQEAFRLPTRDLLLGASGEEKPQVALVTNAKGTRLKDTGGKNLSGVKLIPYNTMVLLLFASKDQLYAYWNNHFGFLSAKDVTLLAPQEEDFLTGLISINGKTAGGTEITVHKNPKADSKKVTAWKPGTPVAVVEKQGDFYLLEGKGIRGWVHEKYVTLDQDTASEGSEE